MDHSWTALAAIVFAACSGLPACRPGGAAWSGALLTLAGALAVVAGVAGLLAPAATLVLTPPLWEGWQPGLLLDATAAPFLIATGLVGMAAAWYAAGYWHGAATPAAGWLHGLFGLLIASILAVVLAADTITFLIAWELMAMSGTALVLVHHRERETRQAGWLFLISTRIAALCLLVAVVLFVQSGHGFAWSGLAALPPGQWRTTLIVLLFFAGFALKAGVVPGHFWLPAAHAAAPAPVSAVLSGVLIKTGIYGISRLIAGLPELPSWFAPLLLIAGAASSLLGVAWALASHDLKRLLAYHSIENIGIILLGLGVGALGRGSGDERLMLLGFAGGLLHVVNHALFKSLLFFGAGQVDHACRTRELDALGGLAKRMPWTAACFIIGAAAISGLPPLNGFASEFLIYQGLFAMSAQGTAVGIVGLVALALTGGLALACFAKASGIVFLGEPRTPAAAAAMDAGRGERAGMAFLAACCVLIGLALPLLVPALAPAAAALGGRAALPAAVPGAAAVSILGLGLIALVLIGWRWLAPRLRQAPRTVTWDCGYAAPSPRMQYTAASFAAPLVDQLRMVTAPERHVTHLRADEPQAASASALFPAHARCTDHPRDPVLDLLLHPVGRGVLWLCERCRIAHPGLVHLYLLYLALAVVAVLAWSFA